jgi:curli biogenesis system outer membrane secretion channel CsgG
MLSRFDLPMRAARLCLTGALLASASLLGGCAAAPRADRAIPLITGPAPMRAVTPVEDALHCIAANYPKDIDLRLAVNDLTDGTGTTMSGDALSKVLTQRPDVMMTIGLAKTGVRMVNRSSTGVAEWEIRQSMNKYIGDGRSHQEPGGAAKLPYRPVMAGGILGSTHYISGAITELNWNVYSNVAEVGVGGLTAGRRQYRISLAVDLIVTDSRSTEIVIARSYTKQLVGTEFAAGLFRFFDVGSGGSNIGPNEVFEFNVGKEANEPVQTAVRWILETAAYDIVAELTGTGDKCNGLLPNEKQVLAAKTDPVRPAGTAPAAPLGAVPKNAAVAANAKPGARTMPAPANAISGVNLFEADGGVIARIDARVPFRALPRITSKEPGRLTLDFPGMANGIGDLGELALAGVSKVQVDQRPEGVRLTLSLKEHYRFGLQKQGRAVLVSLMPVTRVASEVLGARDTGKEPDPIASAIAGAADLKPRQSSPLSEEEIISAIRR